MTDLNDYREQFAAFAAATGRQPVVLVDMDDVLVDFGAGLYERFLLDHPGHHIKRPEERDNFDLFGGETDDHKTRLMASMNHPELYASLKPLPGAFDALHQMIDLGINVRICTAPWATNPTCASQKMTQLEELGGQFFANRAIISKDKTFVFGDLLIDDRSGVTGAIPPTWKQLLFTQPHNRLDTVLPRLAGWDGWQSTVLPMLADILTEKAAVAA
ncbi:5' nucleotidase, NT5C type [Curtobacterium citreum]